MDNFCAVSNILNDACFVTYLERALKRLKFYLLLSFDKLFSSSIMNDVAGFATAGNAQLDTPAQFKNYQFFINQTFKLKIWELFHGSFLED